MPVALTPYSEPQTLQALLSWNLTAGTKNIMRPTLGHHLVLLVEDLHVVAQAHSPADPSARAVLAAESAKQAAGGVFGPAMSMAKSPEIKAGLKGAATAPPPAPGASLEVQSACLEWLRQLMDSSSIVSSQLFKQQHVQSVSVAATSCPEYLLTGPQQVSARVWRHLHHIHVNAAASADFSAAEVSPQGALLATFNRSYLFQAVAQHTLLHLASRGVPEMMSIAHDIGNACKVRECTVSFPILS